MRASMRGGVRRKEKVSFIDIYEACNLVPQCSRT